MVENDTTEGSPVIKEHSSAQERAAWWNKILKECPLTLGSGSQGVFQASKSFQLSVPVSRVTDGNVLQNAQERNLTSCLCTCEDVQRFESRSVRQRKDRLTGGNLSVLQTRLSQPLLYSVTYLLYIQYYRLAHFHPPSVTFTAPSH